MLLLMVTIFCIVLSTGAEPELDLQIVRDPGLCIETSY